MNIYTGDALDILKTMESESVHCCVTSPPYYGLRNYQVDGQIGLEETPDAYVDRLVQVFAEVRRVLRNDGTLWLNLGDSYNNNNGFSRCTQNWQRDGRLNGAADKKTVDGLKTKDLLGIPWRVAFALQADGWYLRSDIIWHKPNPMPESVTDRPTKSHEYIFLLSKSERYFYDAAAIAEPLKEDTIYRAKTNKHVKKGVKVDASRNDQKSIDYFAPVSGRNKRSVWTLSTIPYKEAHFATFPPELPRLCILAGCPEGGIVLDPFNGAGTTGLVALRLGRDYVGIELNPDYVEMSQRRIVNDAPLFNRIDDWQPNKGLQRTPNSDAFPQHIQNK